jgi:hypothetical protein
MLKLSLFAIMLLASTGVSQAHSFTQGPQKTETGSPTEKEQKPSFTLRVADEQVISVSLRCEDAKLTKIAAELSRKLKIPVALSNVMEKQAVTVNFSDLLLEPAMQLLAPVVYIDYQIDSAGGSRPRPLGIFLYAYNEQPPALDAVVKNKGQAFVIQGNTETDGQEAPDPDDPIQVTYRSGFLTAKAKNQPMLDVISEIAYEANVPLDAPADSKEVVTVNINNRPLEEAVLELSPNLRIFVRADLSRALRTILRIMVVEREKNP